MKSTAALYQGTEWRALVFYNHYADVYKRPLQINGLDHIAHVNYQFQNQSRGVDVHLMSAGTDLSNVDIRKVVRTKHDDGRQYDGREYNNSVDSRNNIRYVFKESIKGSLLEHQLIDSIRQDVDMFCNHPANDQGHTSKDYTPSIISVTKIKYLHPKVLLQEGKKEFVPSCILRANLDFSLGCIAGFVSGKTMPSFDGTTFIDYYLDIGSECEYCYALYQHKIFPKSIIEIDKEQLKYELTHWNGERKVDVLRLGKRTEAGSRFTRNQLIATLETCIETRTQAVLPTKFLEWDLEAAKLFKKTRSVVLFSIGDDDVELGPKTHGMDNDFRIEQAMKYKDAGVNSALYLLIDASAPIQEKHQKIIEYARNHNLPIQFLPLRVFSKDLAIKMNNASWDSLKGSKDQLALFENNCTGGYRLTGNGLLRAEHIDVEWNEMIEDNGGKFRMCHHNDEHTWCGTCFIRGGSITETQRVRFEYTKKGNFNKAFKGKKDKRQQKLDFRK